MRPTSAGLLTLFVATEPPNLREGKSPQFQAHRLASAPFCVRVVDSLGERTAIGQPGCNGLYEFKDLSATGLGAGTWSVFGVLFAESYDEDVRGTAACGFYNSARGVQLVTQPLIGFLAAKTGTFAVALHIGAATAVLSAIAIRWLPREPAADRTAAT